MELRQLRYFVRVAELGSIGRAARELEVVASALSQQARTYTDLLGALPPKFEEVLLQLLDRLESSSLFDEESCSFSQKDLTDSLKLWLDKAGARLGETA